MLQRWVRSVGVVTAAAVASVTAMLAVASAASAAAPPNAPSAGPTSVATGGAVVLSQSTRALGRSARQGSLVLVPAPGTSKSSYDPDSTAAQLGFFTTNDTRGQSFALFNSVGLSGSNSIQACPADCAPVDIGFSSTANTHGGYVTFDSGHSRGAWLGLNPFNADNMYLSDSWSANGIAVSFSCCPPGAGFSGSGGSASWSGSVANDWQIDHFFDGVQFDYGALFSVSEGGTATAQFGDQFYSTSA